MHMYARVRRGELTCNAVAQTSEERWSRLCCETRISKIVDKSVPPANGGRNRLERTRLGGTVTCLPEAAAAEGRLIRYKQTSTAAQASRAMCPPGNRRRFPTGDRMQALAACCDVLGC